MNAKLGTVLLLAVLGTTAAPSIDANAYVLDASLPPAGTTTLLLNPWVELLLPDYFDALAGRGESPDCRDRGDAFRSARRPAEVARA
jgi:hypothetical protein